MGPASCEDTRHNHGGSRTRTSIRASSGHSVGGCASRGNHDLDGDRSYPRFRGPEPHKSTRTSAPVFSTRWITHFRAPVFMLTARLGAFLMTLGPALITMSWLDRVHFAFTNPLIVFGRVPFFYYAAHLVLAHGIAIVLNFVRYGRTPFLWIATPSSGRPSDLFPSN